MPGNTMIDHGYATPYESAMYGMTPVGELPPNEYGTERFVVCLTVTQGRQNWNAENARLEHLDGQRTFVSLMDQRRTLSAVWSPPDPDGTGSVPGITFDKVAYQALLAKVAERCKPTYPRMYMWAKRAGKTVELEYVVIPSFY